MTSDFRVGGWIVRTSLGRAERADRTVHLRPKVMDLLVFLAERPGQVVSKEAVLAGVWGAEFVSESALTSAMTELRQLLGDEGSFIENIPKRGYRLLATVAPATPVKDGPDDVAPAGTRERPRRTWGSTRNLAPALLLVCLTVAAAGWWISRASSTSRASSSPVADAVAVAVLPLRNLTGDSSQDWLAEGITDEITGALTRYAELHVIPGVSARRYKGTEKSAAQIARELGGVAWLIDGSVSRDGSRLHLRLSLESVGGNRRVWSEQVHRPLGESLVLARELAERIVWKITGEWPTAQTSSIPPPTVRAEAYEAYLQGVYFRDRVLDGGCIKAEPYLLQSTAIDPAFAPPHAVLAYCYGANRLGGRLDSAEGLTRGHAAAKRALELDPQLADAFVSLALIRHRAEYDWRGAEQAFQRALLLNPKHAEGLVRYGELLYLSGRYDDGLARIQQGVALVPFNVDYRVIFGYALYNMRRFDESIAQYRQAIELDPARPWGAWGLAQTYAAQGRHPDAVREYLAALDRMLVPERAPLAHARLEKVFAGAGWDGFAGELLRMAVEETTRPGHVWREPYRGRHTFWDLARDAGWAGRSADALAALERSFERREGNLVCLGVEPVFDGIRAHPQFASLLRRVGLAGFPLAPTPRQP